MDYHWRGIIIVFKLLLFVHLSCSETFFVKIGTENHVNIVDPRFLSFTVDPKLLFARNEKFISKDSTCMASALTPAYLRLAGSSTAHLSISNGSITLVNDSWYNKQGLTVSDAMWTKFARWSKEAGFDLVYALNNLEKTAAGMWDPSSALKILKVADEAKIQDIVWQLGYECQNQTIEEYLNDLETLRLIIQTFPEGKTKGWRTVGGDVSPCLDSESKSDFKDYVALSNDMLDAIFLDGNSSTHELDTMSERDKKKLLHLLANSKTPLWLTEEVQEESEIERAASWMHSLGQAARNGFAVYFRELRAEELEQPTLSFYMALLFKNLVGEKVLTATFEHQSPRASLYAHCTSLRHKLVPGAVTLYGANLDDEPARFSLKLGKREEGGDILQFILGLDARRNIQVNGKSMFYEGDIKPIVRRVRPYKTLLINLPPKSFGFWVLANTNTEACQEEIEQEVKFIEAETIPEVANNEVREKHNETRKKRDVNANDKGFVIPTALFERLEDLNNDIINVNNVMEKKLKRHERIAENNNTVEGIRRKRETELLHDLKRPKSLAQRLEERRKEKKVADAKESAKLNVSARLAELNAKLAAARAERREKLKLRKSKVTKRNSQQIKRVKSKTQNSEASTQTNEHRRTRRSIIKEKKNFEKDIEELLPENEIDIDGKKLAEFGKFLHKIQNKFKTQEKKAKVESEDSSDAIEEQILLKTRISNDDASIKVSEKSNQGFIRQALNKAMAAFKEVNENLNRMMDALSLID